MAVALGPELDVVALEQLVEVDAHEGPVYVAAEDALYFTTLPRDLRVDVKRLDVASGRVTTIRADANMANGMTLARDGRLLVCEQGTREEPPRIAALDCATGEAETIVDAWRCTSVDGIWAAGDVTGLAQLSPLADFQGRLAVDDMFGASPPPADYSLIPRWSSPTPSWQAWG